MQVYKNTIKYARVYTGYRKNIIQIQILHIKLWKDIIRYWKVNMELCKMIM